MSIPEAACTNWKRNDGKPTIKEEGWTAMGCILLHVVFVGNGWEVAQREPKHSTALLLCTVHVHFVLHRDFFDSAPVFSCFAMSKEARQWPAQKRDIFDRCECPVAV